MTRIRMTDRIAHCGHCGIGDEDKKKKKKELVADLDAIASELEQAGHSKLALAIDQISDRLEKVAGLGAKRRTQIKEIKNYLSKIKELQLPSLLKAIEIPLLKFLDKVDKTEAKDPTGILEDLKRSLNSIVNDPNQYVIVNKEKNKILGIIDRGMGDF